MTNVRLTGGLRSNASFMARTGALHERLNHANSPPYQAVRVVSSELKDGSDLEMPGRATQIQQERDLASQEPMIDVGMRSDDHG
jgi:hypothetical protein